MLTVGSILSRDVVTVDPDAPLAHARTLLEPRHAHHLPVVARGRLVGIVSDRDLIERERSPAGERRAAARVRERMTAVVETASVDEPLTAACRRMLQKRISCLPALAGERLAGILTERDLLLVYQRVCRFAGHDPQLDPTVAGAARGGLAVLSPDDSAGEALERCRAQGSRHLPVVQDGRLVGVVSDRDLLPLAGAGAGTPVGEIMTRDVAALEAGRPLSFAVERMLAEGCHGLPVLERGSLRGMVTSADVLAALCAIDEETLAAAWSGETALAADAEES